MNSGLWLQAGLLVLLLILSAFFSSAETAYVGCNRIRIKTMAEEGNKKALLAETVLDHENKMLSTILIGNNLVNTCMASIASMIAYTFGGYAVGIATFLITFLILVFGEITPKTMASAHSESLALAYAPVVLFLMKVLTPVVWLIHLFSSLILKLFGYRAAASSGAMTENEIRTIVDMSHEEGMIEEDEKEMINNVFDFTEAVAKDVMIPSVNVVMVPADISYNDLIALFKEEQYTRLPVYEDDIDNIIGFLNMKDLLFLDSPEDFDIHRLLRKPLFTVENKDIPDLLQEMGSTLQNMAIVLDEYGDVAGIITVEDILEELVGNIHDEYDSREMDDIKKISDKEYIVKGYVSLHDLNDLFSLEWNSDDFESVGGLFIDRLGRLPVNNDVITLDDGTRLEILQVRKNRIETVKIELAPSA